jgi:hypothetical protein
MRNPRMMGSRLGLEVGRPCIPDASYLKTRRPHQDLLFHHVLGGSVKRDDLPSRQNSRLVGPSRFGRSGDVRRVGEIRDAGKQTWVVLQVP